MKNSIIYDSTLCPLCNLCVSLCNFFYFTELHRGSTENHGGKKSNSCTDVACNVSTIHYIHLELTIYRNRNVHSLLIFLRDRLCS